MTSAKKPDKVGETTLRLTPLRGKFSRWWRVCFTLFIVAAALGFMALRYRMTEMAPVFLKKDVSSRATLIRYLAGDLQSTATALKASEAARSVADARQGYAGLASFVQGNVDRAEAEAKRALETDSKNYQARVTLAQVAYARGDFKGTYELAQFNIANNAPFPFNSHVLAGLSQARLGDADKAINHLQAATRQGFRGNRDAVMLALLATLADFKANGALEADAALAATMLRVLSFWDAQAIKQAERHARRALASNQRPADAWLVIAAAHYNQREFEAALQACAEAQKIDPNHIDVAWMQAYTHAARADQAKELSAMMRAYALAPDDYYIADGTLRALAEKYGDYPKIITLTQAAIARGRASISTFAWLGAAHSYLGNPTEALKNYQAANAIDPDEPKIALAVARNLLDTNQADAAIIAATAVAKLSPNWNAPFELMADVYHDRNNYLAAIEAHETGFSRQRPNAKQLSGLCVAYFRAERYDIAAKCITEVLRMDPTNALAGRLQYEVTLNKNLKDSEQKGAQK